jgi:hypothetical protein
MGALESGAWSETMKWCGYKVNNKHDFDTLFQKMRFLAYLIINNNVSTNKMLLPFYMTVTAVSFGERGMV